MEHGLQFVCCWLLHCGKSARQFLESKLYLKEIKCNIQICPCKGIQNSPGFWIPHREFPIPATWFPFLSVELGFWTPEFQSLVEFWIPWAIFHIPKPRIPDSTSKIFRNPDFITRGNSKLAQLSKPSMLLSAESLRKQKSAFFLAWNSSDCFESFSPLNNWGSNNDSK